MKFARYGIYYTPAPGAFADAGAAWLGWDVARGQAVGAPDDAITRRPRKYGFHGTIKPPFRLVPGTGEGALASELAQLCHRLEPVVLDGLTLSKIGSFLALTPVGDVRALATMAAEVVRGLDAFRAPPDPAELEKRRQSNLSPLQEKYLKDWGYPYVMDAFRFHMTLSGPLPAARRDAVLAQATKHFLDIPPRPFVIDSLTLVGEDEDGKFREISRYTLQAGV
ncbi:DUF1045 domain-containing protein [Roseobacter sp. YSTF-M11]|uniref:DUF1045 domain-containing protein n=1 Tax=Roseobacter insulae TaxID=2859783 RepID=A0A9X1FUN1_9RHOB|nr:DUF1045 domain-containing protein [Roseobacter insulae]MBW4707198.1 DUF1045 domain-containing protein [Roseobacter insulae]